MTTATGLRVRSADGTELACARVGNGPPLVVVDGAGCWSGFNSQRPLAELLADELTVVTYDRRGRGTSTDTPPYAVAREVEDLAAVVATAGGGAAVYGISSGALLALQAAAAGVPVTRLVLFEPPVADTAGPSPLTAELTRLVAAGRHRDAALRFLTSIGVPAGVVDQLGPAMSALESVAPTLVHDCVLSDRTTPELARRVPVPTLVLDSAGSTGDLTGWAAAVVAALPRGEHRSLAGQWHAVPDAELAPVLREFLLRSWGPATATPALPPADPTGERSVVVTVEHQPSGLGGHLDDGVVDEAGRVFVGDFGFDLMGGGDSAPASLSGSTRTAPGRAVGPLPNAGTAAVHCPHSRAQHAGRPRRWSRLTKEALCASDCSGSSTCWWASWWR